jgi:hypothetical protein
LEEENVLERIKKTTSEMSSKLRQLENLRATQPIFITEYNEIDSELQENYRMFVTNMKTAYFLRKELELHSDTRVTKDNMDPLYLKVDDYGLQRVHSPNVTKSSKNLPEQGFHEYQTHKWVVLDGDIDAVWIESMNTVMDDNKVLTLVSNERVPLSHSMRMVFEVNSLNIEKCHTSHCFSCRYSFYK